MTGRAEILADYEIAERMAEYMTLAGISREKVQWFIELSTEWCAKRLAELEQVPT